MLNKRVEQCAEKSFTGPKISYKHTKELDEFFKVTDESSRVKRLRITRDMRNDGKVIIVDAP